VLQDLPSAVLAAGHTAGLIPLQRCVALTVPLRGTLLTTQRETAPHKPRASIPISLVAHHDVLVFGAPEHTEQCGVGRNTLTSTQPTPIRWLAPYLGEDISPNRCHGSKQAA
jgi:hypothetical protein